MKKLLIVLLAGLMVSCVDRTRPARLCNKDILYISSGYRDTRGGGRIPVSHYQEFVVSSTPRGYDTVMTLEYEVPNDKVPLKFNLGDTLHLNFKH